MPYSNQSMNGYRVYHRHAFYTPWNWWKPVRKSLVMWIIFQNLHIKVNNKIKTRTYHFSSGHPKQSKTTKTSGLSPLVFIFFCLEPLMKRLSSHLNYYKLCLYKILIKYVPFSAITSRSAMGPKGCHGYCKYVKMWQSY